MSMTDDPHTWTGALVRNPQGEVLGHVNGVYFHDVTGRATWAAVSDGVGAAMVPLDHAEIVGRELRLPYRVEQLAAAPRTAPGSHLDPRTEHELYRHYGFTPSSPDAPANARIDAPAEASPQAATDASFAVVPQGGRQARAEEGSGEMVLSREELRTGVERWAYQRMRLVTYIVTEDVTFTVPVSRQEVRLEEIPLDEADSAAPAAEGALVEDVHEVVLLREQVHFTTTTVPAERVRLVRRIVEGQQLVSVQLRSEQIDLEQAVTPDDADTPARGVAQPN